MKKREMNKTGTKRLITPAEKKKKGRWDKSKDAGWISADRRIFYSHTYNTRSVLSRLQKIYVDDNLELRLAVKMELFRFSPLCLSNLISYFFSFIITLRHCFPAWILT